MRNTRSIKSKPINIGSCMKDRTLPSPIHMPSLQPEAQFPLVRYNCTGTSSTGNCPAAVPLEALWLSVHGQPPLPAASTLQGTTQRGCEPSCYCPTWFHSWYQKISSFHGEDVLFYQKKDKELSQVLWLAVFLLVYEPPCSGLEACSNSVYMACTQNLGVKRGALLASTRPLDGSAKTHCKSSVTVSARNRAKNWAKSLASLRT